MIVLPSIMALDNENSEYFDDYYIDIMISSIEGKIYQTTTKTVAKQTETQKTSVATVHLKVGIFIL